ncbi:MAG: response regulator [Burkholderiales bacterium]|nr:response regulator [Burkholderiales bacterium]
MPKILVIDDSSAIRGELRGLLEAHGFEVIEADNGEQGLEQVAQQKPDLVISDLNMPGMDGLTMCAHIKAQGHVVPVFMLTTQTSPELKAKAKDCGVVAWIVKPHREDTLLRGIRKVLGLPAEGGAAG